MREFRQGNLKAVLNDNKSVTVFRTEPHKGLDAKLYTLSALATKVHAEAGIQLFQDVVECQAWLDMEKERSDARVIGYIDNKRQEEVTLATKQAQAAIDRLKLLGVTEDNVLKALKGA